MVVPAVNEADNLVETIPQAIVVLEEMNVDYEVLVVDDGSTDRTPQVMRQLCATYPHLRSIRLRRNAGKAAALSIGFDLARNDIFVMMDADGQDEPREIPTLIAKLDEGFDLVTGRRATRQDRFLKRHTSQLYNATTSWVSGVPGRDFNSGLKVLRREVAESVDLYGELHRYLPVLAAWAGFSVTEVEVEHHPRVHGKTKYGIARFWRGFFDLGTVEIHHVVQSPTLSPLRRRWPSLGGDRHGATDLDVHPARHGPSRLEPSGTHHRCAVRGRGRTAPVVRPARRAPRLPDHDARR